MWIVIDEVAQPALGQKVERAPAALAAGHVLDQTWLLVFGAVFLLEELYETGVVALVLRRAPKAS